MSIVFVGEAPALPDVPAFWPFEPGAGSRLAGLMGLTPQVFWQMRMKGTITLVNLFGEPVEGWDAGLAATKATLLCFDHFVVGPGVLRWNLVMLGRKVARAFDDPRPFFELSETDAGNRAVVVPHPSGKCRAWNDKRNVAKFRKVMRELGAIS